VLREDLGHRRPEVFAVLGREGRDEAVEFRAHLGVEGDSRLAAGVGQGHPQCSPVAGHRRSLGEAAPLGPVHQAGERGPLHTEALGQLGHPPRAGKQDAQELGLHGCQVVPFRDIRVDALDHAGELNQPGGGVEARVTRAVMPAVRHTLRPRRHDPLHRFVHAITVQDVDS